MTTTDRGPAASGAECIHPSMTHGMPRTIRERGNFAANVTARPDDARRIRCTAMRVTRLGRCVSRATKRRTRKGRADGMKLSEGDMEFARRMIAYCKRNRAISIEMPTNHAHLLTLILRRAQGDQCFKEGPARKVIDTMVDALIDSFDDGLLQEGLRTIDVRKGG